MTIPTYEPGYKLVLAANLYRNFAGIAVYVKHRKGPQEIRVLHHDSDSVLISCPDRELLLTKKAAYTSFDAPMGDYDEALDFNLLNDKVCRGLGVDYTMTNYTHENPDRFHGDRSRCKIPDEHRTTFLSDSGGLQIVRGMIDKIHPADLATFYVNTVDAGMCLDIPIGNVDRKTFIRAAKLQKRNTDIMLKTIKDKKSKAGLLNIFHGYTSEERQIYREIVEDKEVDRCAIGQLYRQGMVAGVNTIMTTLQGQHYKQYHALGIFSYHYVAIMIKIAHAMKKHITSDTTSFTQSGINHLYVHQNAENTIPVSIKIGKSEGTGNTHRLLKDQCPVCQAVKYTDVLGFIDSDPTIRLLSIHNALEMLQYANMMEEAVKTLSPTQYDKLVYRQLSSKSREQFVKNEIKPCMDFINIAMDSSLKKAQEKYKMFLNTTKRQSGLSNTLFEPAAKAIDYDSILDKMEKNIA